MSRSLAIRRAMLFAALVGTTNGVAELEGSVGAYPRESSAVQAIVSWYGASNLTTILAQSTPFGLNVREPALQQLLGGLPEEMPALAKLASPVTHVAAGDPPACGGVPATGHRALEFNP